MPYRWTDVPPAGRRLLIWPHRSLPAVGFVWVIAIACAGLSLPLLALLGRMALWGLLPFAAVAVAGLWAGFRASNRGGQMHEVVDLDGDRITVTRYDPGRAPRRWDANPYWVRLTLRPGPVDDYLTVTDGGREIELGAFLSPDERRALRDELAAAISGARDQSSRSSST